MDKPYQPANGTEFECFYSSWCAHCANDGDYEEDPDNGCPIIAASMAFTPGEDGYPEEWIYDEEGRPKCTAYRRDDEAKPLPRCERTADMFEVN